MILTKNLEEEKVTLNEYKISHARVKELMAKE